ncbi:hypothetical protein ALC57_16298 [Trachymyrmex cornetzi]|uniref:Uncharacterized protein n=1 Tax=Trachymyrmex cornetzi TaxID=471704 RepID=A0A195DF35_9HYME|nr:hypothetical protein ALC57_16298 [Trachymyrmex cornetzi]
METVRESISDPTSGQVGGLRSTDSNEEGNDKAARPGWPALPLRARASERAKREARVRKRKKGRRGEFAKNRGSFGYRQKSLVMVVEENEQEEDEDGDVKEPCSERGKWKDRLSFLVLFFGPRESAPFARSLARSHPIDHIIINP